MREIAYVAAGDICRLANYRRETGINNIYPLALQIAHYEIPVPYSAHNTGHCMHGVPANNNASIRTNSRSPRHHTNDPGNDAQLHHTDADQYERMADRAKCVRPVNGGANAADLTSLNIRIISYSGNVESRTINAPVPNTTWQFTYATSNYPNRVNIVGPFSNGRQQTVPFKSL